MEGLLTRLVAKIRPEPYNKFAAFCQTGQEFMRVLTTDALEGEEYKDESTAFLSHSQFCEVCSHAEIQTG